MNVLMLSTDANILLEGSDARRRMLLQSEAVDMLLVIVRTRSSSGIQRPTNQCTFIGVPARSPVVAWWKLYRAASRVLFEHADKKFLVTTQDELTGITGFLLARRFGVRWQAQIHTDITSPFFSRHRFSNRLRIAIAKLLYPSASCIRVVSARVMRGVTRWRGLRTLPVCILPIHVPIEQYLSSVSKQNTDDRLRVLMVGRFASEKGFLLGLDVFSRALRSAPMTLTILGDGPCHERLVRRVKRLKIEDLVHFEEYIADVANLLPYFNNTDVLLVPSWYEGYSAMVPLAMASSVLVVMTDVGVAGEYIFDSKTGFVVPVGDVSAMARALVRAHREPETRARLTAASRDIVLNFPSEEDYRLRVRDSWKTCLG